MSKVLKLAIELINELYKELEAHPVSQETKSSSKLQSSSTPIITDKELLEELEKYKALVKKYNEFVPDIDKKVEEVKEVYVKPPQEDKKPVNEIVQISLDLRTDQTHESTPSPTQTVVVEEKPQPTKKTVKKPVKKQTEQPTPVDIPAEVKPEVKSEVKEINVQTTKKSDKNKKKK
jgi:hypothetical protein